MKKKALLGASLALVAALGCAAFTGCSSSDSSTDASSTADTKAEESVEYAPLKVSYLNKSYYEDIIVGDAKGFFKDCGPEVELQVVEGSGQNSVEALTSGAVDIACTGQGPVADAIKTFGDDIVILAFNKTLVGEQGYVAGPNLQVTAYDKATDNKADVKASFEEAAAAKGEPIVCGVQKGSTTANNFKSWLKAMDISCVDFEAEGEGTVKLVDLKANTLAETLAAGDIDMMAASQPQPNAAVEKVEGATLIGSNSDNGAVNATLMITTKEIYAEKEDSIKAFLKADQVASEFLNTDRDEAMKICVDSEGVSEGAVKGIFDNATFGVNLNDDCMNIMQKACKSKEVEIDEAGLKAQMPLYDWVNGGMTD